jgi:hypothetical protein
MATPEQTADMGRTSIQVSDELADELHDRKSRGQSYEDVIWGLIDAADQEDDIAASDSPDPEEVPEDEPDPTVHFSTEIVAVADDRPDRQQLLELLADVDLPGSGTSLERRRQVLIDLYEVLQEEGEMKTGDLQEHADLSGTGYGSMDSFWINVVIKPDQNPLEALPGVEAPGQGGSIWRYQDPDGEQ